MTWDVEVLRLSGDTGIIRAAFLFAGYKLIEEDPGNSNLWFLRHPKYDSFESAGEVHADAIALAGRLREIAKLEGETYDFEVGAIRKMNSDGSTNRNVFVSLSACIEVSVKGEGQVIPNPNISEEERVRYAEEVAQHEAEGRRVALIGRMGAALTKPVVLQVMELLAIQEPSATELGHIIDLVTDDCVGDITGYTTKPELSRFNRSINHPSVMGLNARHAVSNQEPPPKPMTESEAKLFAQRIGREWLKQYEQSKSG
jgi:hypothetical protein